VRSRGTAARSPVEGTRPIVFDPEVLSAGIDERNPTDPGDFHRRLLEELLRDPAFRAEHERIYAGMLEQLAPATEGPVVNPVRKRRGRLVFGDDTGESR
jgi:hypothetical protein